MAGMGTTTSALTLSEQLQKERQREAEEIAHREERAVEEAQRRAARAALEQCLTPEAYARVDALGQKLAEGLEAIFARRGLAWRAPQIGGRSGWVLGPALPRNTEESRATMDIFFSNTRRVFMANRGIWEALDTAGPACSFAHDEADVDRYLEVAEAFVEITTIPA